MNNQTESYIILKPISERFNRIANGISDDEIRRIIESEIREQLKQVDFYSTIQEWIDTYLEENPEEIMDIFIDSLKNRLR